MLLYIRSTEECITVQHNGCPRKFKKFMLPRFEGPRKKNLRFQKNLDSPRILDLGDINYLESQNLCHPNLGSGGVLNLRGHPLPAKNSKIHSIDIVRGVEQPSLMMIWHLKFYCGLPFHEELSPKMSLM